MGRGYLSSGEAVGVVACTREVFNFGIELYVSARHLSIHGNDVAQGVGVVVGRSRQWRLERVRRLRNLGRFQTQLVIRWPSCQEA